MKRLWVISLILCFKSLSAQTWTLETKSGELYQEVTPISIEEDFYYYFFYSHDDLIQKININDISKLKSNLVKTAAPLNYFAGLIIGCGGLTVGWISMLATGEFVPGITIWMLTASFTYKAFKGELFTTGKSYLFDNISTAKKLIMLN